MTVRYIQAFFLGLVCTMTAWSQSVSPARPTPEQLEFQDLELGVFIHYSIDPYARRGVIPGQTPASEFNPDDLDAEQWVLAAKAMGATYVVLTARHEQGFCLWPTKTTGYSVKNSPYRSGQGDVVREFVEACRKHGMKAGLYTAPWIDSHWEYDHAGYRGGDTGDINKFNDQALYNKALNKEKEQIKELLSNYGPLVFVWNDHFGRSDALEDKAHGGKLREFYTGFTRYAHDLQPDCLFLGRDVEHVGTEEGRACYPLWNALNTIDGTLYSVSDTYKWDHCNTGNPKGKFYRPQLAPTTVALSKGGWMWGGKRIPEPLEKTMKAYYETIGRGSGLIVNLTPDKSGRIPEDLVAAAKTFGDEIKRRFGTPVIESGAKETAQVLKFNRPTTFDHVVTMEELRDGQKIASYRIEALVDNQWKTIVEGKTIGHKRIDRFDPVTASELRFTVTRSVAPDPVMRNIAVFNVPSNQNKVKR